MRALCLEPCQLQSRQVSPTVFRSGGYRFYFFAREEPRMHIHVHHADGGVKFWPEPAIELAANHGLTRRRLGIVERLVRDKDHEIRKPWQEHFKG